MITRPYIRPDYGESMKYLQMQLCTRYVATLKRRQTYVVLSLFGAGGMPVRLVKGKARTENLCKVRQDSTYVHNTLQE